MAKELQLKIAEPCHEDWNNMTPVEKGRFCDSCQKAVVDFTGMSDTQLVAFFKKPSTGSACGRFYNDQLDRNLAVAGKRMPWLKYFFQIAIPALLISSKTKAQGETRVIGDTVLCQSPKVMGKFAPVNKIKEVLDTSKICGRVIEIGGTPIPGASIMIKGTILGVAADVNGEFKLQALPGWEKMTLVISSVGFEVSEIVVNRSEFKNEYLVPLTVSLTAMSVGIIVTVRKPKPFLQRIFKDTTFKHFKVYPNPVIAGSIISIELNKAEPGKYETELINSRGQTVYSEALNFQTKKETSPFKIPTIIPGSYSLLLTNKKTGKRHGEKIIVQ